MNVEDMLKIHIFFRLTKYGYIIIYNKKVNYIMPTFITII